jgi:hypothetical protein
VFLSIFICHCGIDSPPPTPPNKKAKEPERAATLTPEQQAEEQKAAREREALALGLRWQYDEWPEKMGRGTVKIATVRSLNEFQIDFPYTGYQRATLTLRIQPKYGKDATLRIEKGQFICGVFDCQVAV